MKLKQIFMLLGAVLLGLTACSKDTPNTPNLSKTLAGTEWECIVQGAEQENGEKDVFTLLLRFVDDTKFTTLGIQKTFKNGILRMYVSKKEELYNSPKIVINNHL